MSVSKKVFAMKIRSAAIAGLSLASLLWGASLPTQAQQSSGAQEPQPPSFTAIDTYFCRYHEGKGRSDLDRVLVKWNKWMDDTKAAPYNAWVMTPYFSSDSNTDFDVLWLGAWQDGNAFGNGLQQWLDKGGSLLAEFDTVLHCNEHSNSGALNIRAPHKGWPDQHGVATITNCRIADGKTVPEAIEFHEAWGVHLARTGSKAGIWAFFPGFGHGDIDWDYRIVTSHPDFKSLGADWESFTNGQGWAVHDELSLGLVSCDNARVYNSTLVRNANINPAPGK